MTDQQQANRPEILPKSSRTALWFERHIQQGSGAKLLRANSLGAKLLLEGPGAKLLHANSLGDKLLRANAIGDRMLMQAAKYDALTRKMALSEERSGRPSLPAIDVPAIMPLLLQLLHHPQVLTDEEKTRFFTCLDRIANGVELLVEVAQRIDEDQQKLLSIQNESVTLLNGIEESVNEINLFPLAGDTQLRDSLRKG